jgi:hypothetical protein
MSTAEQQWGATLFARVERLKHVPAAGRLLIADAACLSLISVSDSRTGVM